MIGTLRGMLQKVGEDELVLDVGGVGFIVSVPTSVLDDLPGIGKSFFLYTRLLVREDSLRLYGFSDPEQRELFDLLLQVAGVGPRLGLSILSRLSPEVIRNAVAQDQPEVLAQVSGIGHKTGQKIIFHLKDRLAVPVMGLDVGRPSDSEVLDVLTALGYSLVEAQAAVQSIPDSAPEDLEERVRIALQYF